MKKRISVLGLFLGMLLILAGCGSDRETVKQEEPTELYVLAAASLTDVMDELIADFEMEHPEYRVVVSYAGSGTLQTQIEEGAPADLFFSAGEKQMNALAEQDLLVDESRRPFLENKVVLIAPLDSTLGLTGFEDLGKVERLGLGEFDSVPVGQYSQEILSNLGLLESLETGNKIVYGSDVRTVLNWVESGEVDAGLVYKTDAMISEKVTIVAEAPEGSLKTPVVYPVAIVAEGPNELGAKVFLEFCSSPQSLEKFISYGFDKVDNQ